MTSLCMFSNNRCGSKKIYALKQNVGILPPHRRSFLRAHAGYPHLSAPQPALLGAGVDPRCGLRPGAQVCPARPAAPVKMDL